MYRFLPAFQGLILILVLTGIIFALRLLFRKFRSHVSPWNEGQIKEAVLDQLKDGLILFDGENRVLYKNQAARSVIPGPPDELAGKKQLFSAGKVYRIERQALRLKKGREYSLCLLKDITESYYYEERLAREAAIQTRNAVERRERVERMSLQMVYTLAETIDAKDKYTRGHSSRVAGYAVCLAGELGYTPDERKDLCHAALLHDIGKISVPDSVLNKPGRLTEEEYEIVKSHASAGGDILSNIEALPGVREAARHHHERYDGKGYPDGLRGENIPEVARIVCIADAYDAMNSRRVYRGRMSKAAIRDQLVKGSGTQFDPRMTEVFLRLMDEGRLQEEMEYLESG